MKRDKKKFAVARKLRNSGWSYGEIGDRLKISKSTLSGWLSDVRMSHAHRELLKEKWQEGLKRARIKASASHRLKTEMRFKEAEKNARVIIGRLKTLGDISIKKVILTALYLGEGAKNKNTVCFVNSNPRICQMFMRLMRVAYKIDENKLRCHLHLRTDQDIGWHIRFWSDLLGVPSGKFHKTQVDARSAGSKTREDYRGSCAIYYYDANIQKELLSLGKVLIERLIKGD